MPKVKDCIVFTNGQVMAFDEKGKQVVECQGFILDVAEKLLKCCNEKTTWHFAKLGKWLTEADFSWRWKKKA